MYRRRTLKSKIQQYVSRKDICCEKDIDRPRIIQQIIQKYKTLHKNGEPYGGSYIDYLNNDLLIFIGYKIDLVNSKDQEGVQLWNELDKRMYANKKLSEPMVVRLLNEVPLFFLLSFLGYATYKESV